MEINRKLNQYICDNGIKQIYLAEKSGIPADTISKMLLGKRKIRADEFLTICTVLEIDPNYFRS